MLAWARAQGRRAQKASAGKCFSPEFNPLFRKVGGPMGDQPVAPTGKETSGLFQKGSPAQPMEARAPHDFEHDALGPGPGNAEHFSLAFTTWRKVKGGKMS